MRIISTLLLSCLFLTSYGQQVKIPVDFKPKTAEDYAPYKDSVLIASKWLISNSLDEDSKTRELANKFMFRWVSGAPYTHIEVKPEFVSEVMNDKGNPYSQSLLMNYIAGMLIVKLETPEEPEVKAQESGVQAMVFGYSTIRKKYKVKFLEKLLKLNSKNELGNWVIETNKEYSDSQKKTVIPKD